MRIVGWAGTVTAVLLPVAAMAQPVSGLYVGAGGGGNFMQHEDVLMFQPGFNVAGRHVPSSNVRYPVAYDAGGVGVAAVGYGFGNGFRVEVEGDYRYNALQHGGTNFEQKYGGMVNGLFDLDVGSPYIYPYIGAGAGYMEVGRNGAPSPNQGEFAYQGIFGSSFPIAPVVGLSLTLEYRFMGLGGASTTTSYPTIGYQRVKYTDDYNHSAMLGLRYAFNVAPPAPPPAPAPVAAPAPAAARTYLVFFDWDRADLSARARAIIGEAAQNSTRTQYTRIQVNGYTDLSGTAAYNQRLSVRRAEAVAAELVRDGVPRAAISIQGFGESNPLVPTAKGVREAQNRRVEIIIQ